MRSFHRVRTKHEYHDAYVTRLEWPKPDELYITLELAQRSDDGLPVPGFLTFAGVRNRPEIEAKLMEIAKERGHDKYIVSIDAIVWESHDVFRLAASPESIRIRCRSFFEA